MRHRERLLPEHVERRASDLLRTQRLQKSKLPDELASTEVDQSSRWLHAAKGLSPDHSDGVPRRRDDQDNVVSPGQDTEQGRYRMNHVEVGITVASAACHTHASHC